MEIDKRARQISFEDAMDRLTRTCSVQEVCEQQAVQKLARWGIEADQSAKIMQYLLSNKFIDNRRFATAFVRDKYKFNKWGPAKIEAALRVKRIDTDIIKEALEEIKEAEIPSSMIRDLEKKIATIKAKSEYERKMKSIAFGVRKGFSYGEVAKIVDRLMKSRDSEED